MRKKDAPPALAIDVLRRLADAGVLQRAILVGSWCVYFYRDYFKDEEGLSSLRTRDMDFLMEIPLHMKHPVDVPQLLGELGFLEDIHRDGYMRLIHPELMIDFLVEERGRGHEGPMDIKPLGIRAQPLRYMSLLSQHPIAVHVREGLTVRLPHPAAFALHKLIMSQRRRDRSKRRKDLKQALQVMDLLVRHKGRGKLAGIYGTLPKGWQGDIKAAMKKFEGEECAVWLED